MATLDLDTSFKLNIRIKSNHSWGFRMAFTDDGDPVTLTGVWKMVIRKNGAIIQTLASDVADSGLIMASNYIELDQDVIANILTPGAYMYEIRHDEDGYSTPITEGILTSKPTIAI